MEDAEFQELVAQLGGVSLRKAAKRRRIDLTT